MPWPFAHAPLRLNLFLSGLHTISAAYLFVWFYCIFWFVFISYGVKDVWAFGLMFPAFHPFFGLGVAWAKALIFLLSPCFSFLCPWASWLFILPRHFIVPAIILPSLYFVLPHELVGWRSYCASPLLCQSFAQGFLGPLFTSLPLLGFIGQHSYCSSPFRYFIPRASLAHLLPLYLFYSHGLFARSFGLPWPNYHILISYCVLGLFAFRPTHWVY